MVVAWSRATVVPPPFTFLRLGLLMCTCFHSEPSAQQYTQQQDVDEPSLTQELKVLLQRMQVHVPDDSSVAVEVDRWRISFATKQHALLSLIQQNNRNMQAGFAKAEERLAAEMATLKADVAALKNHVAEQSGCVLSAHDVRLEH